MWFWMRKKKMKVWISNLVEGEEGMEMRWCGFGGGEGEEALVLSFGEG